MGITHWTTDLSSAWDIIDATVQTKSAYSMSQMCSRELLEQ